MGVVERERDERKHGGGVQFVDDLHLGFFILEEPGLSLRTPWRILALCLASIVQVSIPPKVVASITS